MRLNNSSDIKIIDPVNIPPEHLELIAKIAKDDTKKAKELIVKSESNELTQTDLCSKWKAKKAKKVL
jgi:hypothetical protein